MEIDYNILPGKKLEKVQYNKKKEPIISIITPYHNGEKYIEQTAKSVLNQTFPYFEWIIVDDSSSKKGIEKLKQIEKMDSRIKIFYEKKNRNQITQGKTEPALNYLVQNHQVGRQQQETME